MRSWQNKIKQLELKDKKVKKYGAVLLNTLTFLIVGPVMVRGILALIGYPMETTINNYVVLLIIVISLRLTTKIWRPEDFD